VSKTFCKEAPGSGPCPVCKSQEQTCWSPKSWRLPFSDREIFVLQCHGCSSLFAWPRPAESELQDYHSHYFDYGWYERHRVLKQIQAWHRWQRVQKLLQSHCAAKGRILDVGCGHGHFLHFAKKSGWDAVGLDFPSEALEYARSHYDLSTLEGNAVRVVSERQDQQRSYDVVTAWHCLEHASDPFAMLLALGAFLRPEGILLVAVPNAACRGIMRRREDWIWFQEPYVHTVHLSPTGIRVLAERAGLEILRLWSRDTWDANYLLDARLSLVVGRVSRGFEGVLPGSGFWIYEGIRLALYGIGCFRHWACGIELPPSSGSELLILAAKNREKRTMG
jgi:2-polyprenyl-3-methyl-5-hydroxy-6-metoxy-1,4-benzoquinol methylase